MKQYTVEEIRTYLGNQADAVNTYKWMDYAAGFKFAIDQLVALEADIADKPSYSDLEDRVKFLETALSNLSQNVSRSNS